MCLLFDFYGAMLTPRQQEIFDLYYNDDLSLAEISEQMEISRQAVRDSLVRSRNVLTELDERLDLRARSAQATDTLKKIGLLAAELLELNRREKRSAEYDLRLAEIYRLTKKATELS
ncbi:MAG: DNA-binding protein [Ruminococcaceae bacterium]|nr:DNA-binding protein [Oscillospiraceae bacterium]MBQ4047211.1 DNA-binding protein [Clostridia bacterium]